MGTVYKRGNIFWIKYFRHGKPYYESSKSEKETDAKQLLKLREGEIAMGKMPSVNFEKVYFDDLEKIFISDYKINQRKSLTRAENSVNHLKKDFEGYRVPSITTSRIQAYIERRLDEGAAHATINNELRALKRMLNLGAKQGKVDKVPYIPMLKTNNTRKGFFEHGDFIALRNALPEYLKCFVTFAYKSGWRYTEIRNLTWAQVDLNAGTASLEVGETKNDEARTIYLDDELKEMLSQQWKKQKKAKVVLPWVFPNRKGTGKIVDIRKAWGTACEDAKIGTRLFHDFRRTAVRNMVRAGIPERVAMMVSGHKTRSVFERYNIVNSEDLKNAAKLHQQYIAEQDGYKKVTISPFSKVGGIG